MVVAHVTLALSTSSSVNILHQTARTSPLFLNYLTTSSRKLSATSSLLLIADLVAAAPTSGDSSRSIATRVGGRVDRGGGEGERGGGG